LIIDGGDKEFKCHVTHGRFLSASWTNAKLSEQVVCSLSWTGAKLWIQERCFPEHSALIRVLGDIPGDKRNVAARSLIVS